VAGGKMKIKPYIEKILSENTSIRGFSKSEKQTELVWHRDREDRIIIVCEGSGWQFQRDNCLPEIISEGDRILVNASEYHRLIKGDSDLIVTIIKEDKKKLSKKQKKIAQAAPPPDEITGADFKALRKKKNIDEETDYPTGYEAPEGSKRNKDLDKCTKLYKDGKTKEAAACRQKMEKPHMDESMTISNEALEILINDNIEEAKLNELLQVLEKKLDEKKKKSKSPKGLSKAVKKSLDKKADKRCLTRGSVYAEFRKGLAAFLSSGSRKGMSAHQWAHARVNSAQPSKKWASVKKRKKCPKKKK
jgi:hypothetical protein